MYRSLLTSVILIIMFVSVIFSAVGQYYEAAFNKAVPLMAETKEELERHKKSLENTVSELKSERAGKERELDSLNKQLAELELQYAGLVEESSRITEKLNSLKKADKK